MQSRVVPSLDEDSEFDDHFPRQLQVKSSMHFTPIAVARCAARLLAPVPGMRVLDVGAGPGKFCVVAAREVPSGTFVGIELRPHLVRIAKRLARQLSISNVQFLAGDAFDLDWSQFDAFYFYNPFAEQMHETPFLLDRTLDMDPSKFLHYVDAVCERLRTARIGTRIVTYHGFGASPPTGYDLVETHKVGSDHLQLWIKTRAIENHDRRSAEDGSFRV